MTNFDMVEKLREKANVSYEEAKHALEESNWDLLDAMVYLEKDGKVSGGSAEYSTRRERKEQKTVECGNTGGNFRDFISSVGKFCAKIINHGNVNMFEVHRKGQLVISLPVTVLVVLLIFAFWVVIPLIIVGLFTGFQFSFKGPDLGRENINSAMNRASEMAEDIKNDVKKNAKEKEESKNTDAE